MTETIYLIYQTTNLVNGKTYIGQHQTTNINDGYIGSGTILKSAVKKYGCTNFSREILFVFDSFDDMNNKEIELVTEEYVGLDTNYNLQTGGQGRSFCHRSFCHSEKTKIQMSKMKIGKNNPNYGKPCSSETKAKMSKSNPKTNVGTTFSQKTKQKMSQAHTGKKHTSKSKELMRSHTLGKKQRLIKCPHCDQIGGNAMKRWHFTNCKALQK